MGYTQARLASLCPSFPLYKVNRHVVEMFVRFRTTRLYLDQHFDASDALEGQQQEGHEGEPLALRRLLQASDDGGKLHIILPVHTFICSHAWEFFSTV